MGKKWVLWVAIAAGCNTPQPSFDPFLGRATVAPPVIGGPQAVPPPYYQAPPGTVPGGQPMAPPPTGMTPLAPGSGSYGVPQSRVEGQKAVQPGPNESLAGETALTRRVVSVPGEGSSQVASLEPRVETAGATVDRQVQRAVVESPDHPYGHADDYGWLRGHLEYVDSKGQWKIRYIPIDGETDRFGGSVVLSGESQLQQFQPGDVVQVQGAVENQATDGVSFAPSYRVESISLVSR